MLLYEGLRQRLHLRGGVEPGTGQHPEHDAMQRIQLHHFPFWRECGRNPAAAAQHALLAERLSEPVEVGDPVQQRQHMAAGTHGRMDGADRTIEVKRLAGQDDQIEGRPAVGFDNPLGAHLEVAMRAPDDQSLRFS